MILLQNLNLARWIYDVKTAITIKRNLSLSVRMDEQISFRQRLERWEFAGQGDATAGHCWAKANCEQFIIPEGSELAESCLLSSRAPRAELWEMNSIFIYASLAFWSKLAYTSKSWKLGISFSPNCTYIQILD